MKLNFINVDKVAKEIERKFLVVSDMYKSMAFRCSYIEQGYNSTDKGATIRIRNIDKKSVLTIKSRTFGLTRNEWEYQIPFEDAIEMLESISKGRVIRKNRYYVNYSGHLWEIDEFIDHHMGLVVAEIELKAENETFSLPPFVGEEVTGNPIYYNSYLALNS